MIKMALYGRNKFFAQGDDITISTDFENTSANKMNCTAVILYAMSFVHGGPPIWERPDVRESSRLVVHENISAS